MKRAASLVLLVLAVGVAGAAVAVARKFRYLPDNLNRKVDLTEIELACIKSGFRADQPLVLVKGSLVATEISAVPQSSLIHLTVHVKADAKSSGPPGPDDFESACTTAYTYWRRSLLRRSIPDTRKCPVTIDLVSGSRTLYREIRDGKGRRGYESPSL
jgi:hypothetical protein